MRQQFLIFVCVGVVSALIDIATMQALIRVGVHYAVATTLGFVAGLVANYVLHSRLTFKSASSLHSMLKFGLVVSVNYGITLVCVWASQRWLGGTMAGKLLSLPLVAGNGFLLSRYWIFK